MLIGFLIGRKNLPRTASAQSSISGMSLRSNCASGRWRIARLMSLPGFVEVCAPLGRSSLSRGDNADDFFLVVAFVVMVSVCHKEDTAIRRAERDPALVVV